MTALPACTSASGVQGMARRATHVHCPGEQMHDDVAPAEDRHRQSNIDKSFFQGELSGTHASGVLSSGSLTRTLGSRLLVPASRLHLRQVILAAIVPLTKRRRGGIIAMF